MAVHKDPDHRAQIVHDPSDLFIVGVAKLSASNVKLEHDAQSPWPREGMLLRDLYSNPCDACLIDVEAAVELEEPLSIRRRWVSRPGFDGAVRMHRRS